MSVKVKYYSVREQQILTFNKMKPASTENFVLEE